MTIDEAHILTRQTLETIYPRGEVEAIWRILIDKWMHYTPVDVVLRGTSELPEPVEDKLRDALPRLCNYEPVQYVVGSASFHGLDIEVNRHTLIPRVETEQLVDMIIDRHGAEQDLRVLDVATGSGCIALSLARWLPFAQVEALDISAEALAVARRNARALHCKVTFREADILTLEPPVQPCHDIVVSNPPYIAAHEAEAMEPNVLRYEPHLALFVPDDDALLFYRAIARYAEASLVNGGCLYFEINPLFARQTADMLAGAGFTDVQIVRDLYGRERFASAVKMQRQ